MATPDSSILIQLHIAEYEALTTRSSYMMVIEFSLLAMAPAIPLFGCYFYQLSTSTNIKSFVGWATLAVLQLVALLWANMMLEQFALVRYIECHLRSRIETLSHSNDFWLYEPYLVGHRPIRSSWGNYSLSALALLFLIVFVLVRWSAFSRWDALGVIINSGCLLLLYSMSKRIGNIQNGWAECDKHLVPLLDEHPPR